MSKLRLGICSLAMMFFFFIPDIQVHAKELDEIENYTIEVDNYDDGSLDIQYHIEWRVLNSTAEGPLTWIKVGIPNAYVEDIRALSSNIDKIGYLGGGGDYVRIDLDREYEAGEVVVIDFSIHQHRMYQESDEYYVFSFTPGWFDDIWIDWMEVRWKAYEGTIGNVAQMSGYYVTWGQNLPPGEKMKMTVSYEQDRFAFSDDYDVDAGAGEIVWPLLISVGIPIVWVYYIVRVKSRQKETDFYTEHSGMGRSYYRNRTAKGRGTRSHRSGGCACACACACAGGGRAGCSVKEFYSAKKWSREMFFKM